MYYFRLTVFIPFKNMMRHIIEIISAIAVIFTFCIPTYGSPKSSISSTKKKFDHQRFIAEFQTMSPSKQKGMLNALKSFDYPSYQSLKTDKSVKPVIEKLEELEEKSYDALVAHPFR